jgi:hypothetical protein
VTPQEQIVAVDGLENLERPIDLSRPDTVLELGDLRCDRVDSGSTAATGFFL